MIRNNVTHTGHGPSLSMEGHCEEEEEDFKDNSKLLNLALTYTTLLVFLWSWVRWIFFPLQLLPIRFCFGASYYVKYLRVQTNLVKVLGL
jgi:hypothetical protein